MIDMGETNIKNRMYQNLGNLLIAVEPYNVKSVKSNYFQRGGEACEFTFEFFYGGEHSIHFKVEGNDVTIRYSGNPLQANICNHIRNNLKRNGIVVIESCSNEGLDELNNQKKELSEILNRIRGKK